MAETNKNNYFKGLYLLFFVEMWERFAYYGMRALIVLYMVQNLMFSTQKAGNIYGLYTGFVYLTPIIGGYLADRFFGQRKCITTGAILMSCGLFLLAFGHKNLFLFSLFLMITANGFFKSNISSVLGLLCANNEEQKDSAYTIFYMGINLGAFLSPLICGTLAVKYGYEAGFAASGIGMLIGLFIYKIFENSFLGDAGKEPSQKPAKTITENNPATADSKKQFLALGALMLFTIPFWICFEQAGSSLTLFAQYQTNRNIFGYIIPAGYFQSLNPLFIIIFAPLLSIFWGNLRKHGKEPSSVQKFAAALCLMSAAYIIMIFAGHYAEQNAVSCLWLASVYFVMTIAELCISPIGLSLVSKLAPVQFLSLTMGCWFLTSFFGNLIAGIIGGKYETLPHTTLFGIFAVISAAACIILLLSIPKFEQIMKKKI